MSELADDARDGIDPQRYPPRWLPRALLQVVIAVIAGILAYRVLGSLRTVVATVVIALIIALAMEPAVNALVSRRWRRVPAAIVVMLAGVFVVTAMIAVFGGLFVTQAIQLVAALDGYLAELRTSLDPEVAAQIPDQDAVLGEFLQGHVAGVASGILGLGGLLASGFIRVAGILLIAFYIVADGPRLRRAVCRPLPPVRQVRVLALWEIAQKKLASFVSSRLVLALISAICTTVFLTITGVGYAVPLGLFVGVVSQFIPTVGTYIAGALPVVVGGVQSPQLGLAVLIWIVAYQQFENLVLSPRISSKAMELNPAVAFIAVLAFGSVFGPLGAFIALPLAALAQAVISTYVRRHELIDSALLRDDDPPEGRRETSTSDE